jgi:hypothetical protein
MKLYNLYKELIIENINRDTITNIIDQRTRATLYYDDGENNGGKGKRTVDIYAYGTSKAGNQVVRAYQPFGDTTTKIPNWKLFRVDRILDLTPTGYIFQNAMDKYNIHGDEGMVGTVKQVVFPTDSERASSRDLTTRKADSERRANTNVGAAKDSFTKGKSYDDYAYNSKDGYTDPNQNQGQVDPNQVYRPEDDEYEIEDIESDEMVANADKYYPSKEDNEEIK